MLTKTAEFQSTHPARGATAHKRDHARRILYFNPRTPRGVRLCVGAQYCPVRPFQSTHPARGATFTSPFLFQVPGNFNPRTPRGVRPGPTATAVVVAAISIHAPREGCDYKREGVPCFDYEISIHAPREGCDFHRFAICTYLHHFNPRTPRGVRRSGLCLYHRGNRYFNPRTPRGVRLQNQRRICYHGQISIHAPREGCDPGGRACTGLLTDFNPRTPRGVRRPGAGRLHHQMPISIHAPREGCDGIGVPAGHDPLLHFNPRTPRGVRLGPQMILTRPPVFQSTHPARGATWHEAASAA